MNNYQPVLRSNTSMFDSIYYVNDDLNPRCTDMVGNLVGHWNFLLGSLMVIIALTSILGNSMLLIVLCQNKALNAVSFQMLRSLTVAGILFGFFGAPLLIIQYFDQRTSQDACTLNTARLYVCYLFGSAAFFTVGLMSLNSCLSLVYLQRKRIPEGHIHFMLGICWLIAFMLPLAKFFRKHENDFSGLVAVLSLFTLLLFMASFVGMLIALKVHTRMSSSKSLAAYKEYLAGTTVFVVVVFTVTMTSPITFYHFMKYFRMYEKSSLAVMYNITAVIASANFVVNPFIYLKRDREIRKSMKTLLRIKNEKIKKSSPIHQKNLRKLTEFIIISEEDRFPASLK